MGYKKQTTRVVIGLLSISVLIWILLVTSYVAVRDQKVFTELKQSALTYAEASPSSSLVPSLLPPTPSPVVPTLSFPTTAPTRIPTVSQTIMPTAILLPQPTKGSSHIVAPTTKPLPTVPQNAVRNPSQTPILFNPSGKPISAHPTPTPLYPYQRARIALAFPDIAPSVLRIKGVQIIFYRQNNVGKSVLARRPSRDRWVRLPETKIHLSMRRVAETWYFENVEDIEIKIRTAPINSVKKTLEKRQYGMYVKAGSTVGRFFAGILLKDIKVGSKALLVDCGVGGVKDKACGDLITLRDEKPLFSGDSDGFLDLSPSYNTIDVRDLEYAASLYHKKGGGMRDRFADFNQDGNVDDLDIAVIVANYGKWGDAIDE